MAYSDFTVTTGASINAGHQNANMINARFMVNGTNSTAAPASDENLKDLRTDVDTNTTNIATNNNASTGLYRNAIINPIDENMVDQYGNTGTTASHGQYQIDRWQALLDAVSPTTFTKGTDYIKLSTTATATGELALAQSIEDVNYNRLDDQEITISALVTSNNANCRILARTGSSNYASSNTHTGGGGEELLQMTFTYSGSSDRLAIHIGISSSTRGLVSIVSGDYIQFKNVQTTLGDTVLPYQPRQYSEELALCQRYAWEETTVISNGFIGWAMANSSTQARFALKLPFGFRGVPNSLSMQANEWEFALEGSPSLPIDGITGIEVATSGSSYAVILLNNSGASLSTGAMYQFRGRVASGHTIFVSKEL